MHFVIQRKTANFTSSLLVPNNRFFCLGVMEGSSTMIAMVQSISNVAQEHF